MSKDDLRYERKFFVSGLSRKELELQVKLHPLNFRPVYHPRSINNIYFDTPGFDYYYDNVNGEKHRLKARIRWYGNLYGTIEKPVLEFKIKEGLLGRKNSFLLQSFTFEEGFSFDTIKGSLGNLPANVLHLMKGLKPVIVNSYNRHYYLSFDKRFRVTIDTDLTFMSITNNCFFLNRSKDHQGAVLELKYSGNEDDNARDVPLYFSFPLTKSSKYLQAIERTCF